MALNWLSANDSSSAGELMAGIEPSFVVILFQDLSSATLASTSTHLSTTSCGSPGGP